MDVAATLNVLLQGNQLKRTSRTGWAQRGVANAESVAEHSYGVALAVLILTPQLSEPIDIGRALTMAVLHDLPESLTSDIPRPAWRLMPGGSKRQAENKALELILGRGSDRDELWAAWRELVEGKTPEAHLVHDADRIDLFLQAVIYEEQTGNRRLDEFWQQPAEFHFPQSQALYDALCRRRSIDKGNSKAA